MEEIRNERVLNFLRYVGWSPERRVDISETIEHMKAEGWEIFPAAREFLESFNNLPYAKNYDDSHCIYFVSKMGDDAKEVVTGWEEKYNCKLYPIGELDQLLTIYINDSGQLLYSDKDNFMAVYGEGLNDGLYAILFESSVKIPNFPLERIDIDD